MPRPADLVDIVRDFIVVHQRFEILFGRFRDGSLQFEEVRQLVADSDSSVLFRLKERVHGLFRDRDAAEPLIRGEALFDLAVGSLFHEALKFRENVYQIEVYGPKVRALRADAGDVADDLIPDFEKILRAASDRLGESLRETEKLLGQTRMQLLALLDDAMDRGPTDPVAGFVTRFLLEERKQVEAVYPEGIEALLARVHDTVLGAYLCAIRSLLASARFEEAQQLISEASGREGPEADRDALVYLDAYASGMNAFLDGDYGKAVQRLSSWLDARDLAPVQVDLAIAVMSRLPGLVDAAEEVLIREAREIVARLEALSSART
jgi:hypothetical protein